MSKELDQHDPIPSRYTLEVTSPGVERALRVPAHFQREVGKVVAIRLADVDTDERRVTGVIVAADDDAVTVRVDDADRRIAYTRSTGPGPCSSGVASPSRARSKTSKEASS